MSAVTASASSVVKSPDQQLESKIRRQLAADSRAVSRLTIEVEGGVVTLRGVATSFYQKQLWLHGTKRAAGDEILINDEINVAPNWSSADFTWRD
jgi:osmotically-inducible protein OsmY